ncbi:hypothetical protein V8F20_008072 [Naviculisporaceae sp. PSN 640]
MSSTGRICASCGELRPKTAYTKKQWEKARQFSRCARCVHGGGGNAAAGPAGPGARAGFASPSSPAVVPADASRQNLAVEAYFTDSALIRPFEDGSTMEVARGIYTAGPRTGQPCVCKWVKEGAFDPEQYSDEEILEGCLRCSREALRIVNLFNQEGIAAGMPIIVSMPERWTIAEHPLFPEEVGGVKCLVEPFIEDFKKFNNNRGGVFQTGGRRARWSALLQALSHFSYHVTSGQLVLCDLQGGINDEVFVLADPAVVSRVEGVWGVTDMGPKGIRGFFRSHTCNEYCRSHWTRPGR